MRVLIDECVDPRVKLLFADHEAETVHEKGWDALEDGPLLKLAQEQFDVSSRRPLVWGKGRDESLTS